MATPCLTEICVLCNQELKAEEVVTELTVKGRDGINRASEKRGDKIVVVEGQRVHVGCRKKYTNIKAISVFQRSNEEICQGTTVPLQRQERLDTSFNFQRDCLFCGNAIPSISKQKQPDSFPVRTEKKFSDTIRELCQKRNDDWAQQVFGRLEYARNLHAKDALYHQSCSVNFRTNKRKPVSQSQTYEKPAKRYKEGRPIQLGKADAFHQVVDYLQAHKERQFTVSDLVEKMSELTDDPYSTYYMKRTLQDHFGDKIVFAEIHGKADVVTLRDTVSEILHDFYNNQNMNDPEAEKRLTIKTAARLILSDIRDIPSNKDNTYPVNEELSSLNQNVDFLPSSLKDFLDELMAGKDSSLKVAAIGQAIMQSARPRKLICPLQIGLGIQMHHLFGSRRLNDTLNSLGFCSSYSEVKRFESSAAISRGVAMPEFDKHKHLLQYVADNVDHNSCTLDGFNTFHGMGMIGVITPGVNCSFPVKRIKVTAEDVAAVGKIKVHFYRSESETETPLILKQLPAIEAEDPFIGTDILWKTCWLLRPNRPSWAGFMQSTSEGAHEGTSNVMFLPIIDLNPNDLSCIFSTLIFLSDQAKEYHVDPIVTFDQPLYWKARMTIDSEPSTSLLKSIVLRLGGFHMQMSFLGCIGYVMGGSGLEDALEVIYAPTTVGHMLTGKAVARALRGHFIVDTALHALIISRNFGVPLSYGGHHDEDDGEDSSGAEKEKSDKSQDNTIERAAQMLDDLLESKMSAEEVCETTVIASIDHSLSEERNMADKANRPTAKLWFLYMDMVEVLRKFIRAERTGNWKLHLQAVADMLPFFAACGHNAYVKSSYVYLQSMLDLHETSPSVYRMFMSGKHTVRRTDRFWAGLSTDLVIEQVLMRSLKSSGGLTRGRGLDESQRMLWLLSMPACAAASEAMDRVTGCQEHNEQHVDVTSSRRERDRKDAGKLFAFLQLRNPFADEINTLRNISTGFVANDSVNITSARLIGKTILTSMSGKDVKKYSFSKKERAVNMSAGEAVKTGNDTIPIDPCLLFQRLVTASKETPEDQRDLFKYELSAHPASLFESSGLMRGARKSDFADSVKTLAEGIIPGVTKSTPGPEEDLAYVLDGGSLIYRIPWPRGQTYDEICQIYVDYVIQRYKDATIVFDGYDDGPSIKDTAHIRRHASKGTSVLFNGRMVLGCKKEALLSNLDNKQRFINLLSSHFHRTHVKIIQATGDADVLITTTATESAKTKPTIVVGEDTDLLILLCYHADPQSRKIFFRSDIIRQEQTVWDIHETKSALGQSCQYLLFTHALLGCDSTSRLYGIGKKSSVKHLLNLTFQDIARSFLNASCKDSVTAFGEKALLLLYGCPSEVSLDTARYHKFIEKTAAGTSSVEPQNLPPTSAAAKFHSWRVYYQVKEWTSQSRDMDPTEWGWKQHQGHLMPIHTDLPPAPPNLLTVIRCSCKTDCRSSRCSCKKHGLECSFACKECHGTSCTNKAHQDVVGDDGADEAV